MPVSELNVAIVALVISLIALTVTTQQLLVQVFGSADGYRQCAESVIGSWHKKRTRIWKWSEFRFETQYVTPQIVLMIPSEFEDHWKHNEEELYRVSSRSLDQARPKELADTVHEVNNRTRLQTAVANGIAKDGAEKGARSWDLARSKRRTGRRSETQVTWLRLLREMHVLTQSYCLRRCPSCDVLAGFETLPPDPEVALESVYEPDKSWKLDESSNRSPTEVGIIYRTWNWGFMPAELTRPLAEVSMGDIVILALRMGMQWRVLDLESGRMQADGNGFNLTGFEARGLGIVLRLTATEQHSEYRMFIPTRAVDKMLLGILPGDPELVGRDFLLVTKDFGIQPLGSPQGILAAIMPKDNRDTIAQMDFPEVRVDVITLLLTYLPLEGCTMTKYAFPGWNNDITYNKSVYCWWEGRLALHRALRKRVDSGVLGSDLHDVLSTVLGMMDHLEGKYMNDWYIRLDKQRVMRNQKGVDNKRECMQETREIFAWTQVWLKQHTFGRNRHQFPDYTELVAAHAYMATHAIKFTREFLSKEPPNQNQSSLCSRYDVTHKRYGSRFDYGMYETACHYVKLLHNDAVGFHAYLTDNHQSPSIEYSESAWWVMQLRGIVWHFSTWHPEMIVRDVLGEQLIPSTFYGNKSPVWIT